MRLVRVPAWMLVAAAPLLFMSCQPAGEVSEQQAPEKAPTDEEAMAQLQAAFAKAWAEGDSQTIAGLFSENGDTISPDGEAFSGREAIAKRYRELFDGMYRGTTITIATTSIRFLEPDVAVVDGSYEVAGMKGPDGKEMAAVKGLYTNLAVKGSDGWRIACSRPMIPVKLPGTT